MTDRLRLVPRGCDDRSYMVIATLPVTVQVRASDPEAAKKIAFEAVPWGDVAESVCVGFPIKLVVQEIEETTAE